MEDSGAPVALMAGLWGFFCIIYVVIWAFFSLCMYKIAQKAGVENAWLAWVPIVQVVPFLQAAGKPLWWIILLLIPFANIVVAIIAWMAIAERLGKPSWLGILMIVPIANLIIPAYLAFSE